MLDKELEKYYELREELLEAHSPQSYVVIKDQELYGVFPDHDKALTAGLLAFGDVSFLVKPLEERVGFLSSINRIR